MTQNLWEQFSDGQLDKLYAQAMPEDKVQIIKERHRRRENADYRLRTNSLKPVE